MASAAVRRKKRLASKHSTGDNRELGREGKGTMYHMKSRYAARRSIHDNFASPSRSCLCPRLTRSSSPKSSTCLISHRLSDLSKYETENESQNQSRKSKVKTWFKNIRFLKFCGKLTSTVRFPIRNGASWKDVVQEHTIFNLCGKPTSTQRRLEEDNAQWNERGPFERINQMQNESLCPPREQG
jgi:hypothetical protein